MLSKLWGLSRWFVGELVQQFVQRDCLSRAASLTYTTLFAVVPFMTVTYIILSTFSDLSAVGETIKSFIFTNFVPESSRAVQEQLTQFSEQALGLTSFSVAFLFVTSFLMIVTIERAFNVIWQVPVQRRGLQRFLLYWGVLTFGPPLLVGGLIVSSYLLYLPFVSGLDTYGIRESLLAYIPIASEVAVFTFLYYAVPNCRVVFKHALIGGFVTMILFEVAKNSFSALLAGSSMAVIYGAFAAVPLFLFWLYLVWVLILVGAVLVRTLAKVPESGTSDIPALVQLLSVLQVLYDAHLQGDALSEDQLLGESCLEEGRKDTIMNVLFRLKLVGQSDDLHYALTRSLKTVTLWDLYQKLPEGLNEESLVAVSGTPVGLPQLLEFFRVGARSLNENLDSLYEKNQHAQD